jgi:hypothetical protein
MLICVALLPVSATGCGGAPEAEASPGAKAAVDQTRGTVTLPLDQFMPTAAERNTFTYAVDIKAAECAKSKGVDFRPIDLRTSTPDAGFGVWQLDRAEKYGYDRLPAPGQAATTARNGAMSETESNVIYACQVKPELKSVKFPSAALGKLRFMRTLSSVRPIDTKQGQSVLKEWQDCLKASGITPPGMPEQFQEYDWTPPEVKGMNTEARLRTAVTDVKCKEKVRLVQRLADIQAGMQQKVISEHASELVAYRDLWRARLATAQKVIDGYHGV